MFPFSWSIIEIYEFIFITLLFFRLMLLLLFFSYNLGCCCCCIKNSREQNIVLKRIITANKKKCVKPDINLKVIYFPSWLNFGWFFVVVGKWEIFSRDCVCSTWKPLFIYKLSTTFQFSFYLVVLREFSLLLII